MPGPVSDSYDPVFGTGVNADAVIDIIRVARDKLSKQLGSELANIVDVAHWPSGRRTMHKLRLTERDCRALRFAANRALEDI